MGSVGIAFLEIRQGSSLAPLYTAQNGFQTMFTQMYIGPSNNESLRGNQWFVTFINDFS